MTAATSHPFLDAIARGVVLADGATGTLLRARGHRGRTFEAVLDARDLVRRAHEEYIEAGAGLLLTASFDANRAHLTRRGRTHADVRNANFYAARIARDAREIAGVPVLIGGSVGPIGRDLVVGAMTLDDAVEAFREQIGALVEGGVDLIVLETFPSLREADAALRAARSVTNLPVVAMLNFNADLATPAGESPTEVVRTLTAAGADVVGINCGVGPQAALDMLQEMANAAPDARLAVKPNAGLPRIVSGAEVYPAAPEYFADFALRAKDLGASIIGGCCGTTPDHVRAMSEALRRAEGNIPDAATTIYIAQTSVTVAPGSLDTSPALDEPLAPSAPSLLRDKLKAGKYVVSVEIDPPRGINPRKAIEGAALLRGAGADAINIGDSPMARVRMSALALAVLIQREVGIETIIHQTSRDKNLMALQSDLLGAHALGVRNVIALTGDPSPEASQSSTVWDVDSVGFIRVLKRLNEGIDFAGNSLGRPTHFFVACAANPTADDLEHELRRVREKLDAGADMLMTQPAYDVDVVRTFFERLGPVEVPVLLGVLPLMSSRHAEFIHNELAGVHVPEDIRERMRKAGEAGATAGLELALEHTEATRALPFVSGIYVMPSFGRYEVAADLVRQLSTA
jgi:methionine synthase I (cobalamin-dependent)/5,10-methylenetetrahydrofolate reductase